MSDEFMGTSTEAPTEVAASTTGSPEGKSDYTEFLAAITNSEGKQKYKTVADALLGAAKAQEHIARIEAENAQLRTVTQKVETLEQVLTKLDAGKPVDQPSAPKIEDQEALIASVLEKREAEYKAKANKEAVLSTLTDKFGEKANEILSAKARELGLTVADLGAMAAKSPKAVLKYFDVEAKGTPTVQGTVNTQALQPATTTAKAPENIMLGAGTKELVSFWRQLREEVNQAIR